MNYKKIPRYLSGIPLEKAIVYFLNKMGLSNSHNSFNLTSYMNESRNIVDIVAKERGKDKVLIECTNPKQTTFMNDRIMESKIDYFHRKDPTHNFLWVLVISFLNFSKEVIQRLIGERIQLVVLNKRVNEDNFHGVVRGLFNSTLFQLLRPYSIKYREQPKKTEPIENTVLTNKISSSSRTTKGLDSYYYLYQYSNKNRILQVFDVIGFLAGNLGKIPPLK